MPLYTDVQAPLYKNGADVKNEYEMDPGVCVLPIAQDPPTSAGELSTWSPVVVLRLHAPYRIRKVRYDITKTNNPPILPSPQDAGKFVFVGGSIEFSTAANGTLVNYDWSTVAQYTYIEDCVSRVQDGFVLGRVPWNDPTAGTNAIYYGQGPNPQIGAVSQAGVDALAGYNMGISLLTGISSGAWGYNQDSFFPGTLFNDQFVNGGPTSAQTPV